MLVKGRYSVIYLLVDVLWLHIQPLWNINWTQLTFRLYCSLWKNERTRRTSKVLANSISRWILSQAWHCSSWFKGIILKVFGNKICLEIVSADFVSFLGGKFAIGFEYAYKNCGFRWDCEFIYFRNIPLSNIYWIASIE